MLPTDAVTALYDQAPGLAQEIIDTLISEISEYATAFSPERKRTISGAVKMGVTGFIRVAGRWHTSGSSTPQTAALQAAYDLGAGEARSGRSMDSLQAAYRIGAQLSWRSQSVVLVQHGMTATDVAQFAELVFAYIDQLAAASVAGHADARETAGLVRERLLADLAQALAGGEAPDVLDAAAERAGWKPPKTLTAVVLPEAHMRPVRAALDAATLRLPSGTLDGRGLAGLLVPDTAAGRRPALLRVLDGHGATVGPARPWRQASVSLNRALRCRELATAPGAVTGTAAVDSDDHLANLVTHADPVALADLRAQALEPVRDLRPSTAERLTATLRSWLLHQGRRDEVAAELHVHPQTIRYRMTQLREIYGDRLQDPVVVRDLVIALG